ncbi:hypothetical protein LCGC14_0690220 [marine sediment metagenome]|uniref:Uncharacterized protein n=1 Tax=marine sediment metagenome TaxID=412755 RepID=A0A0F9TTN1_9ZZZZ|nr:hypothetical protein [Candidatus Aminicenantes bacterium]
MKGEKKKSMKENYNAVHNLLEQHAGLNALRDIFSGAMEAEKIIAALDKEIKHREELVAHLEVAKERLKGEIGTEYKKFKEKQRSDLESIDKAWEKHNKRVDADQKQRLGILETEVKNMVTESEMVRRKLDSARIELQKLEDKILLRESQLKAIDDQINKLKEAIG